MLCPSLPVNAQRLKVVEESGHLSPLMVKIVFMDNKSRTVMLRGVGVAAVGTIITHTLGVMTDGGASKRTIWLDTIAAIEGTGTMRTRESEFTVILKNGEKVAAIFTGSNGCNRPINEVGPDWTCKILFTANEDDGDQKIDLQQVKSVQFLGAARKDKAGNAMFDSWRYSPLTGEKLPQ